MRFRMTQLAWAACPAPLCGITAPDCAQPRPIAKSTNITATADEHLIESLPVRITSCLTLSDKQQNHRTPSPGASKKHTNSRQDIDCRMRHLDQSCKVLSKGEGVRKSPERANTVLCPLQDKCQC